jgi:hypothetical protein
LSKNPPNGNDYDTFITIGVGRLSSVRLWYQENGKLEKTRPKYVPLEWSERDTLESTRSIKLYITVGSNIKTKNTEEKYDTNYKLDLENLSVTSI